MKIAIIGSRGLPASYGGFETFAEEISVILARHGYDVTVQCDKDSFDKPVYRNVNLFFSKVTKSSNPLKYYYEGLKWATKNCDIVFAAGSVGSLFYPFFLSGRKIIITNTDGIEYQRSKWSMWHRAFLRFTELLAVRLSAFIIADSLSIDYYLRKKYNVDNQKVRVIEYGSYVNESCDMAVLEKHNLSFKNYWLVVCRLEPENNIGMIIEGFLKSGSDMPLVIVGQVTGTSYIQNLVKKFRSDKVLFAGGIYDKQELNSLRFGCMGYLHGHSVGGTNPSLLEAMGNGNIIICHDNPFNREVTDNGQIYFSSSGELSECIRKAEGLSKIETELIRAKSLHRILNHYNWNNIAAKYIELISEVSGRKDMINSDKINC